MRWFRIYNEKGQEIYNSIVREQLIALFFIIFVLVFTIIIIFG